MLWSDVERKPVSVLTDEDLRFYTHIVYLDASPGTVYMQTLYEEARQRPHVSISEISRWQHDESRLFVRYAINTTYSLSHVAPKGPALVNLVKLISDFAAHSEEYNLRRAEQKLDEIFERATDPLVTLVLDADKSLAAADAASIFWEHCNAIHSSLPADSLNKLFRGPLGYSYSAFRQAVLLYEEAANALDFDAICKNVAACIELYAEMDSFLQQMSNQENVVVLLITCGLSSTWQEVLIKARLDKTVHVLGGSRIDHGFVISPKVKGALVSRLQKVHRQVVHAFGDSPLDIDMLKNADETTIIVAEEGIRSISMDSALSQAIASGLKARQVLFPRTTTPRLSTSVLPVVTLNQLANSISAISSLSHSKRIMHGTNSRAAKILATSTRNANKAGPQLREAYRSVGRHLALNFLSVCIGLERYDIPHVQSGTTNGFRISNESHITIVALMRGGEPIANGINDILPTARFVHAKKEEDLVDEHVKGQSLVLLVDTVINKGGTMARFVDRVRSLTEARIIMIAGVVQEDTIHTGGRLSDMFADHANLELIALRTSKNKFKGCGTTDTSNRLFNTTNMQ